MYLIFVLSLMDHKFVSFESSVYLVFVRRLMYILSVVSFTLIWKYLQSGVLWVYPTSALSARYTLYLQVRTHGYTYFLDVALSLPPIRKLFPPDYPFHYCYRKTVYLTLTKHLSLVSHR